LAFCPARTGRIPEKWLEPAGHSFQLQTSVPVQLMGLFLVLPESAELKNIVALMLLQQNTVDVKKKSTY